MGHPVQGEFFFLQYTDEGKPVSHLCHLQNHHHSSWARPITELQLSSHFIKGSHLLLGHFCASQSSSAYWWSGYLTPFIKTLTLSGLSLEPLRDFGHCRKICHHPHPPTKLCIWGNGYLTVGCRLVSQGNRSPHCYAGLGVVAHPLPWSTTSSSQPAQPVCLQAGQLDATRRQVGWLGSQTQLLKCG